jgi:hypothetical protein
MLSVITRPLQTTRMDDASAMPIMQAQGQSQYAGDRILRFNLSDTLFLLQVKI